MKLNGWPTANEAKEFTTAIQNEHKIIYDYKDDIMFCIKQACERGDLNTTINLNSIIPKNTFTIFSNEICEWLDKLGYVINQIQHIDKCRMHVTISWEK